MRKRLLFIMDFAPGKQGSMEAFFMELAGDLARRETEVCYLFSGECPEWFKAEVPEGTTLLCSRGSPLATGNFLSTMRTVLRLRPSVLSFWFVSMFSWRTLLLTRLPFVESSIFCDHTSAAASKKRGLLAVAAKWRGSLASVWYDMVVSVSEHNRRRNIERNFIRAAKTRVIYNGVQAACPADAFSAESFLPDRPYLLFSGQLIREKGVHTLLHAFSLLVREESTSEVRLVLAGEGAEGENLRRLARDLGIEERAVFLGLRNDVPRLMSEAVATVVPSEWPEAFGFTVAEAMAAGCPVIVSDAGALPEIAGDTGLSFAGGNAGELAARMRSVLRRENAIELSARVRRAQARARATFSLDRMVREYADLLTGGTCG